MTNTNTEALEALNTLEEAVKNVSRLGATTGKQWFKLTLAMAKFCTIRAALTSEAPNHREAVTQWLSAFGMVAIEKEELSELQRAREAEAVPVGWQDYAEKLRAVIQVAYDRRVNPKSIGEVCSERGVTAVQATKFKIAESQALTDAMAKALSLPHPAPARFPSREEVDNATIAKMLYDAAPERGGGGFWLWEQQDASTKSRYVRMADAVISLLTQGEAQTTNTEALEALETARDQFDFYVTSHLAKVPPDTQKAETNRVMRDKMQRAIDALTRETEAVPVPVHIGCPQCGEPHIDEGEWAARPHKTHQCQKCGHEWRPFPYPTVGVAPTRFPSREEVVVPPMPECDDRQPFGCLPFSDKPIDGYMEGNRDWCDRNSEVVAWLIDNHAAIRAALTREAEAVPVLLSNYRDAWAALKCIYAGVEEAFGGVSGLPNEEHLEGPEPGHVAEAAVTALHQSASVVRNHAQKVLDYAKGHDGAGFPTPLWLLIQEMKDGLQKVVDEIPHPAPLLTQGEAQTTNDGEDESDGFAYRLADLVSSWTMEHGNFLMKEDVDPLIARARSDRDIQTEVDEVIAALPKRDPAQTTNDGALLEAAKLVVAWWLETGMHKFNAAPYAMFALRKALSEDLPKVCKNTGKPKEACTLHNLHCAYPDCMITSNLTNGEG